MMEISIPGPSTRAGQPFAQGLIWLSFLFGPVMMPRAVHLRHRGTPSLQTMYGGVFLMMNVKKCMKTKINMRMRMKMRMKMKIFSCWNRRACRTASRGYLVVSTSYKRT